jgi:hypothetical protein
MPEFTFPTNAELREIAQDLLPRLAADRPVFDFMPIEEPDAFLVMWEQEDSYTGLQAARGLNGEPPKVQRVGVKRYQMQPGVYGEFIPLDETELTVRRQYGTWATPVDLSDLVMRAQRQLLVRRLDRIETINWNLLGSGTFSVPGPSGAILHQDTFALQTFTASVPWATVATATPLADLRAVQLLARGHSVRFDRTALAFVNQKTANSLLANTNAADIYGRRVTGLATVNSIPQLNELLTMDNLPNIVPYDMGYLADPATPGGASTFVPFIPDATAIVIGKRTDGAPIGNYQMVRNATNPDMGPGAYMKVIDRGEIQVPRAIEVHDGHNGGPAIFFPSAIVRMSV